ncbi:MAG: polymer-forming cytoskeletal protein [Chloroflexi bacterium]|nr:polymer-forming cytoskeletal protein [Chloroflexota bacterium]
MLKRFSKLGLIALLIALGALAIALPARAADSRTGDTIVIGANEIVNDDLYAFANLVTIDGRVKGDVIGAASRLVVNGTIEGDVLFGAQTIIINGAINDDARIAAQVITLGPNARIGSDLLAAGFSIENQVGSTVGGDFLVGAYQVLLAGNVGKNVNGGTGNFDLRGTVNGNVTLELGDDSAGGPPPSMFMGPNTAPMPNVAPGLTIAESAKIGGKLTYTARADGKIAREAQITGGAARRDPPVRESDRAARVRTPMDTVWDSLRQLIALILIGSGLLQFAPAWTRALADTLQAKPLPAFGWGIVAFIAFLFAILAIIVATIVLMIGFGITTLGNLSGLSFLVGGLSLATLLIGFGVFTGYIAQIVVGYLGGRALLAQVAPAQANGRVAPFLVGIILLVIVMAIPFLGGAIGLVVTFLGLGALWLWFKAKRAM